MLDREQIEALRYHSEHAHTEEQRQAAKALMKPVRFTARHIGRSTIQEAVEAALEETDDDE